MKAGCIHCGNAHGECVPTSYAKRCPHCEGTCRRTRTEPPQADFNGPSEAKEYQFKLSKKKRKKLTERDDSVLDNTTDNTVDTVSDTVVSNTDVHGPNQRDNRVWSAPEKAYESFNATALAHERDQAAFDADREQERRHTEELHKQALRHTEELFQQRLRREDDLHVVTVQALTGSQVADQSLADAIAAATVKALVSAGVTK